MVLDLEAFQSKDDMVLASPPQEQTAPAPLAAPIRDMPVATSEELVRRYDQFEGRLLSQGLLRQDGGGLNDVTPDTLATNFLRIALYDEYSPVDGRLVAQEASSRLRRWTEPVRVRVAFGNSVSTEQRQADLDVVAPLLADLSEASGLSISLGSTDPVPLDGDDAPTENFTVFVVNETERLDLRPELSTIIPGITPEVTATVLDILPSTFCLAVAFSNPERPYEYRKVVAIIRAEHPALLRQACFHEEIAQGLGLANDSREARPSIFNDDEEFALLTDQDRLMVRMLYDARLSPGMDVMEADPIARDIAVELLQPDVTAALPDPEQAPP